MSKELSLEGTFCRHGALGPGQTCVTCEREKLIHERRAQIEQMEAELKQLRSEAPMDARDHIAIKVLERTIPRISICDGQGYLKARAKDPKFATSIASFCYDMADAMLEERDSR